MNSRIKFIEGFKDGTIFPRSFQPGEVVVVTEGQLAQIRRSGGVVEVIEHVIPNPKKHDFENKEPKDPQNPENEINFEGHVPGLEDEVAEIKERKAKKK